MPQQLRWGILSAARIAREWVAPAIHASVRGCITAVASHTPGKAEALATPYGDVRCHADYDALLADPNVDAVYIPLPNAAHVAWTERAVKAGKHVLCEKPIALEASEIDHLIRLRDQSGLIVAEAFMVVHHPQWARVRSLVAEGVIGRLSHVQGGFSFFNDDPANIRNDPAQGGGALRDIGVYPAVTTRFVTGEEPETTATRIAWDHGIDASARVWAEFPSFTMDFFVSMRRAPWQQMLFHGDKGWIRVAAPFNAHAYGDEVIEIADGSGARRIERYAGVEQYTAQIDAFNAAVLTGAPFACPLEFSRGNQRMIDMIYAAG